jgi:hypothetical protein
MTIRKSLAAAPFAHLLGLAGAEDDDGARKGKHGRRAEDDGKKEKEDRDATRAEDDKDRDRDEAAEEDDKEKAEEDDKDDEKSSKAKKAKGKRADDEEGDEDMEDDDDDDEMRGNSASAKARRRERARCAAIFGCSAAGKRPDVAASIAFGTSMGRREAISVLKSVAAGERNAVLAIAPGRSSIDSRMASLNVPQAGADAGTAAPAGMSPIAAAIVAAGEKARGK